MAHEKHFPDEKLCLMSVLNGLPLRLLDFEIGAPPKTAILGHFWAKMAAIFKIFKISKNA